MIVVTLEDWLHRKFREWEDEAGGRQTYKTFADYLGIKYTTFSSYINQGAKPQGRNLRKIGDVLGYEIYDIVGSERPDPLEEIKTRLVHVPKERSEEVYDLLMDWLKQNGYQRQG